MRLKIFLIAAALLALPNLAIPKAVTYVSYYATSAAAGATTVETAITLTRSAGNATTTTGTSFVVGTTSGKNYHITAISFATRGHSTATIQETLFSLRIKTDGAVTTTSTPILLQARSATAAVASAWDRVLIELPGEGFEIGGDGTLQFGVTAKATYTTNAPTWDVTILGYEL